MLSKTLKKLRAKPEPTRRLIALTISLGFTAIVLVMWGVSFIPYASSELNKASLREAFPQLNKSAGDLSNDNAQNTNADNANPEIKDSGYDQNTYNNEASAFVGSSLEPVYDEYTSTSASNNATTNSDGQSANAQATTTNKVLIQ